MSLPYRIVLADDHALVRQGIRMMIEEDASLSVVGEAGDGLELVELLKKQSADMVILDISMPRLRGIEAIREIRAFRPDLKVLVITMHGEQEYFEQSVAAGVQGYLLKQETMAELLAAIRKIRQGGVFLSPLLASDLTDSFFASGWKAYHSSDQVLTEREKQVLKLIAEGYSNKEIAGLLSISPRTVERHRISITQKLGMKKTAKLVKHAIQKGYL